MSHFKPINSQHQNGAVLFTGLMLLLVLTLLGLSSVQNSTIEAKIANNYTQRNITFQAADSAINSIATQAVISQTLSAGGAIQVSNVDSICLDPTKDADDDCGDFYIEANARARFLGSAPAMGNSIGTFTTYHFNFTGEGSIPDPTSDETKADRDKDISRTLLSKGGYMLAPKI